MSDILDYDWINSLGQLYANVMETWWPVHDIEVQTGLMRIDVCGKLDVMDLHDARRFKNDDGEEFEVDDFYLDSERATGIKH